ncbi:MAG: hypothetical protein N2559_12490 [Anaerolineae bacterium]|nr:hypothetical protein [Anaerolineae bacterium]
MRKLIIHHIGLGSSVKFGCGLGALANLIPGLVLALVSKFIIATLRALLESWQSAELANIFGQSIRANMLAVLRLEGALKTLQFLDNAAPLFILLLTLAWMLLGGVGLAVLGGISAAIYNTIAQLFGGIEIQVREE